MKYLESDYKPSRVTQTVLHDPENGAHGNCFSAVLSSLLNVPIENIPVFTDPITWMLDVNKWLRPYGLAYLRVQDFAMHAEDNGIIDCWHELAGRTHRPGDVLHATVGRDGDMVYDPHPDNSGLKDREDSGIFIALHPWKVAQREAA